MGSGGAKFDLCLIMKIIALICCAVAVGINVADTTDSHYPRIGLVSNSLMYADGAFIIILAIFLGWTIFEDEVDKKFAGIILICGCIWLIGGGLGVIIFKIDYSAGTHAFQLVGGILGLVAGVVMLVDGLHNFGCF